MRALLDVAGLEAAAAAPLGAVGDAATPRRLGAAEEELSFDHSRRSSGGGGGDPVATMKL